MQIVFRVVIALLGGLALAVAVGFLTGQSWAIKASPFFSYPLGHLFIASLLAAIGAPLLWIAISGELAAIAGGALNLAIAFGGMAAYGFSLANGSDSIPLKVFAVTCAGGWFIQVVLFLVTYRLEFADKQRTPSHVRIAFGIFTVALLAAGIALIARVPNVFPWVLSDDLSFIYGCIFLGNAAYFAYGLVRPVVGNARGQLIGFLAYDLVLAGPFLNLWPSVPEQFRSSLTLYLITLIGSGILAVHALLFDPVVRLVGRRPEPAA